MVDIGDLIDEKYRLIRQLGQGGMGTVYEALHEEIDKPVAVKMLRPQGASQGELVARFHREARAAASAGHRGIIDIYDVGVGPDESPYLVMELLEGESLGDRLDRQGRLDLQTTAYIVCQVLSALSAAHDAGVVHRDLKPENIFLVDSGAALPEVKLLDFGISRVVTPGTETRMTRTGAVIGTPQYMSPEQAAGKSDIDHLTDIFAVGVILYECLTGALPFDGENYNAIMAKILTEDPIRPRQSCPDLPHQVDDLIWRTLHKAREHRPQSASELFGSLRPLVAPEAVASLRAPRGAPPDTAPQVQLQPPVDAAGSELPPTEDHLSPPAEAPPTVPTPPQPKRKSLGAQLAILALVVVVIGVVAGVVASSLSHEPETTHPAVEAPATVEPTDQDETEAVNVSLETPLEQTGPSDESLEQPDIAATKPAGHKLRGKVGARRRPTKTPDEAGEATPTPTPTKIPYGEMIDAPVKAPATRTPAPAAPPTKQPYGGLIDAPP